MQERNGFDNVILTRWSVQFWTGKLILYFIKLNNLNIEIYLQFLTTVSQYHFCRTCGGGGASGVMLANRLSPTTSRRPTLNPSSSFHNHHKHAQRIQQQCHQNEKEHILKPRKQDSSKACKHHLEFEDKHTRPPTSKHVSSHPTSRISSISPLSFISSSMVLKTQATNQQSSDDLSKECNDDVSSSAIIRNSELRQRRRLVHSTTTR